MVDGSCFFPWLCLTGRRTLHDRDYGEDRWRPALSLATLILFTLHPTSRSTPLDPSYGSPAKSTDQVHCQPMMIIRTQWISLFISQLSLPVHLKKYSTDCYLRKSFLVSLLLCVRGDGWMVTSWHPRKVDLAFRCLVGDCRMSSRRDECLAIYHTVKFNSSVTTVSHEILLQTCPFYSS